MSSTTPRGTRLARIPDVCADCTAWADLVAYSPGVTIVEVYHDASCPSYRAHTARTNERKNR